METPQRDRHILVIGGAGYIGSVLVRKLIASGYRVRALDALLYQNEAAISELIGSAGFSFQHGDFCRSDHLKQAIDGITDVVFLAALVGDPVCRKFPDLARQINEKGTLEFLERLDELGICRFIFMSTCSNYGLLPDDVPASEETELNPQSLYAETKVKVERQLLQRQKDLDCCLTVLRAATAYGLSPRMRFDLTVNEFIRELALGHELVVYDASTWRPYCHVDDLCAAIMLALQKDTAAIRGQVFNVGSDGENYTKQMIVDLISNLLPEAKIRYQAGSSDPRNYRVTFQRIAAVLGFQSVHAVAGFAPSLIEAVRGGRYDSARTSPGFYANLSPLYPFK